MLKETVNDVMFISRDFCTFSAWGPVLSILIHFWDKIWTNKKKRIVTQYCENYRVIFTKIYLKYDI